MAESLLVGRNFVPGICKLKSKNLKNIKPIFLVKNPRFYQLCFYYCRSGAAIWGLVQPVGKNCTNSQCVNWLIGV